MCHKEISFSSFMHEFIPPITKWQVDLINRHPVVVGIDPAKPGSEMCVKAWFKGSKLISIEDIT